MRPSPRFKRPSLFVAGAASLLALAACGGALDSLGSSGTSSTSGSGSTPNCSSYVDVINSTVRSNANEDTQCSLQIANADSYLSAAKAACAIGNTSGADAYYSQYLKAADYATSVVKTLCPGSGSSTGPALPVTTYNLFACVSSSGYVQKGLCTTANQANSTQYGCTWYNYGSNYTSLSACTTARDRLLN